MLFTTFQDLLKVIQVFANFWQYLNFTGDDINCWVYVLTLDVITGVCYLTRQRRLQKTTTTTVLGITFNSKLRFEPHISYITHSAAWIFCIESIYWYLLLVFECLYVYFDVLHSLHLVCRLVYLTYFHFCTHIHAVVIIWVCQIFIKETACLLVYVQQSRTLSLLIYNL